MEVDADGGVEDGGGGDGCDGGGGDVGRMRMGRWRTMEGDDGGGAMEVEWKWKRWWRSMELDAMEVEPMEV